MYQWLASASFVFKNQTTMKKVDMPSFDQSEERTQKYVQSTAR
jgi:hypothetical protein